MANKKYIEIKIAGLTADLPAEDPNIQLTYVNPCAGGFGTISGNKSERSLTLPATKQNDDIFEQFWKVGLSNTPTAAEEKPASIQVNGVPVMSGKAQLKQASTVGRFYERGGDNYQVSFVGANADWFELLGDLQLGRDLDWSDIFHTYDAATIIAGYNNSPLIKYAYGIIKLKGWGTPGSVDLFESTPLLFISDIVNRIFNSIGYTISSVFFNNSVVERYVIPAILNDKYPQEYSEDYLNIAAVKTIAVAFSNPPNLVYSEGFTFDSQTKTPPAGPNPFVLSTVGTLVSGNTGQYTAPDAGFYQVFLNVTVSAIVGTPSLSFAIVTSAGSPLVIIGPVTAVDNGTTYNTSLVVELEVGDVIEYIINVSTPLAGDSVSITASTEIIGEAKIQPGSNIDITYLLRDWKITDFIKGLTAAFNLCWETNVDLKTIVVEPKDDYLITDRLTGLPTINPGFHTNTTTDSTPKLDFNKDGRVTAVNSTAETQQYQWKQDGADKTAEAANELEDIPFDASKYVMPLNRFNPKTEENENPFFGPTIMVFDNEVRNSTSLLVPLIPLMWPDNYRENTRADENTTTFTPRLLWFGGQRAGSLDGLINSINSTTGVKALRELPALFFVNYNDPTGLDVSLNWSSLTIGGNTVQGQMQRFYLRELRRLRAGKELEEWVYWDELDILNLSFRPKVFLDQNLYIMKEINSFSPLIDRSTKTVFVYDLPAEQEDVNRIENTLAIGFIGNYTNPD